MFHLLYFRKYISSQRHSCHSWIMTVIVIEWYNDWLYCTHGSVNCCHWRWCQWGVRIGCEASSAAVCDAADTRHIATVSTRARHKRSVHQFRYRWVVFLQSFDESRFIEHRGSWSSNVFVSVGPPPLNMPLVCMIYSIKSLSVSFEFALRADCTNSTYLSVEINSGVNLYLAKIALHQPQLSK